MAQARSAATFTSSPSSIGPPPPSTTKNHFCLIVHLLDQKMYDKAILQLEDVPVSEMVSPTQLTMAFQDLAKKRGVDLPRQNKCNVCGFPLPNGKHGIELVLVYVFSEVQYLLVMTDVCGKKKCQEAVDVLFKKHITRLIDHFQECRLMDLSLSFPLPPNSVRVVACSNCKQSEFRDREKTFQCCKGCRSVYYCDKKCQTADWPLHKPLCLAYSNKKQTSVVNKSLIK